MVRIGAVDDAVVVAQMVDMWQRVAQAGGGVGFAPDVTREQVESAATTLVARAAAGLVDLAVAFDDGSPVAMGVLDPVEGPLTAHLAAIRRLMRDPRRAGEGLGAIVLAALEHSARRRGVTRVVVEVRRTTDLSRWYARHGFVVEATLPDRLRVDGRSVAVDVMSKRLDGEGDAPHAEDPGAAVTADGPRAPQLAVQRLDPGLPSPSYAHAGDAGLDLHAREDVHLDPGCRAVVPTGVAIAVPPGHVGLVNPRSGLAARHGVGLVNAPGTIDEGYRGEVMVVLVNHDLRAPVRVSRGDRIAQLLVQPVARPRVLEVERLPPPPADGPRARGAAGFGSSGR